MPSYTVLGVWIDDQPVVAAVIAGEHDCVDATGVTLYQRWATSVDAPDPDTAEEIAIVELREDID